MTQSPHELDTKLSLSDTDDLLVLMSLFMGVVLSSFDDESDKFELASAEAFSSEEAWNESLIDLMKSSCLLSLLFRDEEDFCEKAGTSFGVSSSEPEERLSLWRCSFLALLLVAW